MRSYQYGTYSPTNSAILYPNFLQFNNAREYYFFVEADMGKLTEVCDMWINQPCDKKVEFKPASTTVMIKITDCTCRDKETCSANINKCAGIHCRSTQITNGYGDPVGYMQANSIEFSFFVENELGIVHLLSPFRYSDNGILMVNERELLGFPTTHSHIGQFDLSKPISHGKYFHVKDPIKFFSPEHETYNPKNYTSTEPYNDVLQFATLMAYEFPEGGIVENEFASGGVNTQPEVQVQFDKGVELKSPKSTNIKDAVDLLAKNISRIESSQMAERLADIIINKRHYVSMSQLKQIEDMDMALVQTFFDIHGNKVKVRGYGTMDHAYDISFDKWLTHSVNAELKKDLELNELITANLFNLQKELGLKNVEGAEGCYVDLDFTLEVSKLIAQQF